MTNDIIVHWPHKSQFPIQSVYTGKNCNMVLIGDLVNNIRVLHLFTKKHFILNLIFGPARPWDFENLVKVIDLFDINKDRFWVLCNTPEQQVLAANCGLQSILFNNNALLDENVYKPNYYIQQEYDAICVSRLIKWKRVSLASKVPNLALVPGHWMEGGEYESPPPHRYMADGILDTHSVVQLIQQSRTGLILSAAEGACMASSEYLLCGVPVVSTPSEGGRDIWYNEDNCIICKPTEDDVLNSVEEWLRRYRDHRVSSEKIHKNHVSITKQHRQNLINLIDGIFRDTHTNDSGERVFKMIFYNKLVNDHKYDYNTTREMLGR